MSAFLVVALFLVAFGAGILGGLVGTGSSLILLPLLVAVYGPREAVPIMAIAAVCANVGRVAAWWREIDWAAVLAYAAPGVPAAVLGARTLLAVSPRIIDGCLGAFFLAMIAVRRRLAGRERRTRPWQLAMAGLVVGFLTGVVLATGPLSVPVFIGYGLTAGRFLGTEAASALILYLAKTATFGSSGALSLGTVLEGVVIGLALTVGPFAARPFVRRAGPRAYGLLIDAVLAVAAVGMTVTAVR